MLFSLKLRNETRSRMRKFFALREKDLDTVLKVKQKQRLFRDDGDQKVVQT